MINCNEGFTPMSAVNASSESIQLGKKSTFVGGRLVTLNTVKVAGTNLVVTGKIFKTARVFDEWYNDAEEPSKILPLLKSNARRIDLYTFIQRPPDLTPLYNYHLEWEEWAAIKVSTYKNWWEKQIPSRTRNAIRKAEKNGVRTAVVDFSHELIEGIVRIFNETPIKRGKPFKHYGKDHARVEQELGTQRDRCDFIAAYYEGELIGFIKLLYAGSIAAPCVNLAMMSHRDKAPASALMAKVVEICAEKGIPFVEYAFWRTRNRSMRYYLAGHGFEVLKVPRYYVPLTLLGRAGLKMGLHRDLRSFLPESLVTHFLKFRQKWYEFAR
jgi:hypothetical protein